MTNQKTILSVIILTFTLFSWSQNSPFETKAFKSQEAFSTFDNTTIVSQNTYQTLAGDPGPDPDAPIDSGILFLLASGLLFGFYKFLQARSLSLSK